MERLIVLLFLVSCAQLTPEEAEWRRAVDLENYAMCAEVYRQAGKPMFHRDHTHRWGRHRAVDVKDDLVVNNCKQVLRDSWADY